MTSSTKQQRVANLRDLVDVMRQSDGFADVREALSRGESAAIDGAWGSSCALAAAALAGNGFAEKAYPVQEKRRKKTATVRSDGVAVDSRSGPVLLIVLPRISEVDDFAVDLAGFLGRDPEILPAWESVLNADEATDPVFTGRMRVLRQFDATPASAVEKNPSPAAAELREAAPPRTVVVTSFPALLQPVPSREQVTASTRTL